MSIDRFYLPFTSEAYRIIPDGPGNDPLDASFAAFSDKNRWNLIGEPTLYLGSTARVMAVEWARHVEDEMKDALLAGHQHLRRIYQVKVRIDRSLDLRDAKLCDDIGISSDPTCFANSLTLCQRIAHELRVNTEAQAILVPSMGLLEQPDRFCIVLFADKLAPYPGSYISVVDRNGTLPKWFERD